MLVSPHQRFYSDLPQRRKRELSGRTYACAGDCTVGLKEPRSETAVYVSGLFRGIVRCLTGDDIMDGIIYLVGLIVVIMAILSFLGLH